MSRFDRIDNTAPVVDVAENIKPKVKYSKFDLSRKVVGQANPYAIIPIDTIMMLPNSDIWLNYDVQVNFRNPTLRKLMNGFRVYLHAYYNRNSDLWEGWNNFITKGRNGTMNLKIPHVATRLYNSDKSKVWTPFTPMSLYDYLGWTPEAYKDLSNKTGQTPAEIQEGGSGTKTGLANYTNIEISALKPTMYQRLWRDKYAPQNLLQNQNEIFPENEDHFILSYSADEITMIKYEDENNMTTSNPTLNDWVTGGFNHVRLDVLRYRQFQGDRFTTASPFEEMLRGTAPKLNVKIDANNLSITIPDKNVISKLTQDGNTYYSNGDIGPNYTVLEDEDTLNLQNYNGTTEQGVDKNWKNSRLITRGDTYNLNNGNIETEVILSQIRKLKVLTIFSERMARATGNYNSLIKAQYGHNPKADNREAIYIGGSYQDIMQNSIFQTSESTNDSALGRQVSQGISQNYNKLGHFHSDDYGIVMVCMTIVPDTVYTQGISKLDTALTMEEQYFPIFNNLSPEPILNKELFVSGNEEDDNDVYGYAERFSEYKSRRNKAVGFSQLDSTQDAYDSALIMARKFETTPQLNANFVTGIPDNVPLNSFSANNEPPFDFNIIQDVEVNYPMPYITVPDELDME